MTTESFNKEDKYFEDWNKLLLENKRDVETKYPIAGSLYLTHIKLAQEAWDVMRAKKATGEIKEEK